MYKEDKGGMVLFMMEKKCKKWVEYPGMTKFKSSDGWLNNMPKNRNLTQINQHGDNNDIPNEERDSIS